MDKEEYYNKIKDWVYGKFDNLDVTEHNVSNVIYLRYKNDNDIQIRIYKNTSTVNYYFGFKNKIAKVIRLNDADFEILLGRWIEDVFNVNVRRFNKDLILR